MQNKQLGAAILAALLSVSCSSETAEMDSARTVTSDGDVAPLARNHRSVAELASSVLADDLGIPVGNIVVDSVRAVDWPNSSIGCPQPDEAYLDVITPGHKILLRVDGSLHIVHEANGRAFVCRQTKATALPGGSLDVPWLEMGAKARVDLAAAIGVPLDQVILAGADKTTFSDSSLGCPHPDQSYDPGYVDGFVIRLRNGSRNYTYHTDLERVIACPAISSD